MMKPSRPKQTALRVLLAASLSAQAASQAFAAATCKDPASGNAHARAELPKPGLENIIAWGLKQGLLIGAYDASRPGTIEDQKGIFSFDGHDADLSGVSIGNIQLGQINVQCKTTTDCDISVPLKSMNVQASLAVHATGSTTNDLTAKAVQFAVQPNAQGQQVVLHFKGKIDPNAAPADRVQIQNQGLKIDMPTGTYKISKQSVERTDLVGYVGKEGYNLLSWISGSTAQSKFATKVLGRIVSQYMLPSAANYARTFTQTLIPIVDKDLTQNVPMVRIQDYLDLSQIDDHVQAQVKSAAAILKALQNPSTKSLAQVQAALKGSTDDFKQILDAFSRIRDIDSAQKEFDQINAAWTPVVAALSAKLAAFKASPSLVKSIVGPYSSYLAGAVQAQKVVQATSDHERETLALHAATVQLDDPTQSVDLAVTACIYCSPNTFQERAIEQFPAFKSEKNFDVGVQVPIELVNSVANDLYKNHGMDSCISSVTAQPCVFAPKGEEKKIVELTRPPVLKMDGQGLYLDFPPFKPSGAAFGLLDQFAGARVDLSATPSADHSKVQLSITHIDAALKVDPDSHIAKTIKSIVKNYESYTNQYLKLFEDIAPEWKPLLTASGGVDGVSVQDISTEKGVLSVYTKIALPDLDPEKIANGQDLPTCPLFVTGGTPQ